MIVITGATGRLGGAVLSTLLENVQPTELGASTTDPSKAAHLGDRGVRVRRGDLDDLRSLEDAFEGADRVLLVSAPRIGPAAIEAHQRAITAAQHAGVGRLLYTSHVGADALSPFPPAVTHAATEVLLRDSGLAFTAVRNGFYADTPVQLLREAATTGELRVPEDAPVSWAVHADLAPAIAALLLDEGLDETVVNLTGGEAIDMSALADAASKGFGRPVRHVTVDDETYRSELVAAGAPAFRAEMTLGIFRASRQRRLGIVDPTLERLTGRAATRVADLLVQPEAD